MDRKDAIVPDDCRTCGACCSHYYAVDVEPDDENFKWLEDNDYLTDGLFGPQMKFASHKRCIALVGTVGEKAECSIYDHRPNICMKFKQGSNRCKDAILIEITRHKTPESGAMHRACQSDFEKLKARLGNV